MAVSRAASTPKSGGDLSATAVTSGTLTAPTSVANGEFLVGCVNTQAVGINLTTPTGWTLARDTGQSSASVRTYWFYKVWQTGDATTYSLAFSGAGTAYGSICVGYNGVDSAAPFGTFNDTATNTSGTTFNIANMTTGASGSMAMISLGLGSGSTTSTTPTPSGYTQASTAAGKRVELWDKQVASSGTLNNPGSFTLTAATQGWTSHVELLSPQGPYVGAGAVATASSGNVTPTLPAGILTGDALILDITALDNVDCSVAVSGGSGNAWTRKGAQNNGTSLRKEVWWKRRGAGDTDTAAAVTHTGGSKIIARVHALRLPSSGDPFEAFSFGTAAAATTGDFPTVTTLTANAFMVFGFGYAEDFIAGPSISNAQGLTITKQSEAEVS